MYSAPTEVESAIQLVLGALNLHSLSTDELKQFLNDDDKLNDKINNVGAIQAMRNKRDMAVAGNKSLAEYNLSRQPRIMELKSRVQQQLEESEEQETQIREKRDKLSVVDQPLDTTLALLQTAAAQSEEESENLVQSVLGGEMSLDNFLELYLPKRQTAIVRRVKVDKLKELVRSQGGGGSGAYRPPPTTAPAPAVPSPYRPGPGLNPYGSQMPYPSTPYPPGGASTPYPPGGNPTPYPPAGNPTPYPSGPYMPPQPAVPYPYMPGGMPLPRY